MNTITHGGDIYRNKVSADFSTSVNPYPLPENVVAAMQRALKRAGQYPDLRQERLRGALAAHYGVMPEQVVCGNGASELILAVFHAIRPGQTVLQRADYGGYRRCAGAVGSEVIRVDSINDRFPDTEKSGVGNPDQDFLLLFSLPNNPTGRLMSQQTLMRYFPYCKDHHLWLVIDASFLDLTEQAKTYWKLLLQFVDQYDRCIVISSFTKSFALPGARMGYLFCDRCVADRIREQLPECNVSVIAEEAGIACLQEWAYLSECIENIAAERKRVSEALKGFGFTVYPSDANFILFRAGIPLYEALLEQGILIRDCADFFAGQEKSGLLSDEAGENEAFGGGHYYRIAVRQKRDNTLLLESMDELLNKG